MLDGMNVPTAKELFFRTRPCKFYIKGKCKRGQQCTFVHVKKEPPPELFRTRMCTAFQQTGFCENGDACAFAHTQSELRSNVATNSNPAPQRVSDPPNGCVSLEDLIIKQLTDLCSDPLQTFIDFDTSRSSSRQTNSERVLPSLESLDLRSTDFLHPRVLSAECGSVKDDLIKRSDCFKSHMRREESIARQLQGLSQNERQQLSCQEHRGRNQYSNVVTNSRRIPSDPHMLQVLSDCDVSSSDDQNIDEHMDMAKLFDRLSQLSSSKRASPQPGGATINANHRCPIQNTDLQSRQLNRQDLYMEALQDSTAFHGRRKLERNVTSALLLGKANVATPSESATTEALQQLVTLLSDKGNSALVQQALDLVSASRQVGHDADDFFNAARSNIVGHSKVAPSLDANFPDAAFHQDNARHRTQLDRMPCGTSGEPQRIESFLCADLNGDIRFSNPANLGGIPTHTFQQELWTRDPEAYPSPQESSNLELGTSMKASLPQTKSGLQNQFGVVVKNTFIEVEKNNLMEAMRIKSFTAPDLPLITEEPDEEPINSQPSVEDDESPCSTPRAESVTQDENASSRESSITHRQLEESLHDLKSNEDTSRKLNNSAQPVPDAPTIVPFSSGGNKAATVILRQRF
mmetsp:Transcript_1199/g.1866  ORF Transcript_1199/g.1866 Transcript_1199/m.1866 type:complete len:633 (+) Transcript_1199:29-1927(+)